MTTKPIWLAGLLFLGCSHDSKRDNPLDPALTPPVELQVAVDDSIGVATLTWTPFEGEAAFAEYRVVRSIADRTTVDTLAVLRSISITSFVDSSLVPETAYSYRILVVSDSGFESASEAHVVSLSTPAAVRIEDVDFNSHTASAVVTWSEYSGRGFQSYQLLRIAGFETQTVVETRALSDTTYVDTDLKGNTEYSYQVVVVTDKVARIPSPPVTGAFHQLVDSWPVDVEDGGYVRLYRQEDHLVALVSEPQRVRHIALDTDGAVREEQVLLQNRWLNIAPFTVNLATFSDGTRYLGLVVKAEKFGEDKVTAMLLAFDDQGAPVYVAEHTSPRLDMENLANLNPGFDPAAAYGLLTLHGEAAYDNVSVSSGGRELVEDGFSSGALGDWRTWGDAAVSADQASVEAGEVVVVSTQMISRTWEPASSLAVETDLTVSLDPTGIQQLMWLVASPPDGEATDVFQGLQVKMSPDTQDFGILASYADAEGVRTAGTARLPFPVIPGLTYKLRIDVADGAAWVSVSSPMAWSQSLDGNEPLDITGLVTLDDFVVFATAGGAWGADWRSSFDRTLALPMEASASELRAWETTDGSRIGLCMTERHQISIGETEVRRGRAPTTISWPSTDDQTILLLGSSVGQGEGEFVFPLSFDYSSDGRIFFLDAGNGRIQSFTDDGTYITGWGTRGSEAGQFDFGSGVDPVDFAGSILVDDEGFIYVADVGNKRIQKFAP